MWKIIVHLSVVYFQNILFKDNTTSTFAVRVLGINTTLFHLLPRKQITELQVTIFCFWLHSALSATFSPSRLSWHCEKYTAQCTVHCTVYTVCGRTWRAGGPGSSGLWWLRAWVWPDSLYGQLLIVTFCVSLFSCVRRQSLLAQFLHHLKQKKLTILKLGSSSPHVREKLVFYVGNCGWTPNVSPWQQLWHQAF